MGKGGGSQAPTNTNTIQTSLPAYAEPYMTNLMQQGLQAYSQPFQAYQGQMVAGMSPGQLAAQSQLGGMQAIPGAMNEAGQIGTNVANSAANFNPNVTAQQTGVQNWTDPGVAQQYMSPYTSNVMSAQQALMSQQNQQQLNDINSKATQAGAFGGDRQAIADAAQNQSYQLALGNMQANALQNAYGQGQNTFLQSQGQSLQSQQANQQANLQAQSTTGQLGLGALNAQMGAGQNLGYLGNMQQNAGLNYIQALNQMGGQQQQQQQNYLNNAYTQFQQQLQYPQQMAQGYSSILHGVPVSANSTATNYTASPSLTSQIGGLGTMLAGAATGGGSTGLAEGGLADMYARHVSRRLQ